MQCFWWVGGAKDGGDCEADIESNVGGRSSEGESEECEWLRNVHDCVVTMEYSRVTYDNRAQCTILYYLRADDRISQQSPERSRDDPGMYCGKNGESCGALLDKGTSGEELKRESEEIEYEEEPELDATDSGLSPTRNEDEVPDEEDAEAAGDDVGDVGERAVDTDERDAALWIYADRSFCGAGRYTLENG